MSSASGGCGCSGAADCGTGTHTYFSKIMAIPRLDDVSHTLIIQGGDFQGNGADAAWWASLSARARGFRRDSARRTTTGHAH